MQTNKGHILYLCADRGIPFGASKGGSIHIREFVEALSAVGYVPTVVTARCDPTYRRSPAYPVHTLPQSLWPPLMQNRQKSKGGDRFWKEVEDFERNQPVTGMLADIYSSDPFDLIYERYSLFSIAGYFFARSRGMPFVLEVNAPLVKEASTYRSLVQVDLAQAVERFLLKSADCVVAVCDQVRDHVHSIAPDTLVEVIPNGVNLERFDKEPSTDWRPRLSNHPDSGMSVGFVGSLKPWHGVEILIEAVSIASAESSNLSLAVIGGSGKQLSALTENSRLSASNVKFIGTVPHESIPDILSSLDVVVAPYPDLNDFYFSPLKVYEYMAAGKAIVASSIGQIRQILTDGVNALLVPPGDKRALADALLRLQNDPGLRQRLGGAARHQAEQHHSWISRMNHVSDLFDSLKAGASGSEPLHHANSL